VVSSELARAAFLRRLLLKMILATGEQLAITGVLPMKRHFLAARNERERKLSLKRLVAPLLRSRNNALRRQQLLELHDRLLCDIGLGRYEVLYGAAFDSEAAREKK
jgi:uncharacterized protein YjiS (DUF1127 family)